MTDQNSEELAKRLDELEKKYNELKAKLIQESELQKRENELKIKEVELKEREINLAKKELELAKKEKDSGKTTTSHSERHPVLPVYKKLNNGMEMPLIGLGTSRINKMIDTAFKYGNEEEVGKGIKKALDDGLCKREELFIIGKIWIAHRNDPEKAIKETLQKLQLDYFMLIQVIFNNKYLFMNFGLKWKL